MPANCVYHSTGYLQATLQWRMQLKKLHSKVERMEVERAQCASLLCMVVTARKKCSERCKHCVLAVVRWSQKFSPHRRPLPRGAGRPKFNQLEMVTAFTYKPSLVRINARNFELSW